MVLNYHFEDIDFTRQRSEILDIKSENAQLKTKFKEYIKIYGIIFGIFLLGCLLGTKNSYPFVIIMFVMGFISIFILYFFQCYQVEYSNSQEILILKKWYGVIKIPKRCLKKVYIKSYRKSGTNLYINYINNKNKEKCILLDIFALELDEIREFLDIFLYKV